MTKYTDSGIRLLALAVIEMAKRDSLRADARAAEAYSFLETDAEEWFDLAELTMKPSDFRAFLTRIAPPLSTRLAYEFDCLINQSLYQLKLSQMEELENGSIRV